VDRKGNFTVRYREIAEETMKPRSPDSPFRESLRVVFGIEGEGDQTVSLSVTIEDPADDLWGFVTVNPDNAPAGNEAALRAFIEANVVRDPVQVYVSGFIQSRQAQAGAHVFERILWVYQYNRGSDGQARLGMVAVTKDGQTTSWTCPEPQFDKRKGDTPEGDYIGPLSPDAHAFLYLQTFGLDWKRMEKEDLTRAEAYWPGHFNEDGQPIEPLFPDLLNPWPGFLAIIDRHGWKPIKMEIENHPQYGIGPKRLSKGLVKMIEVERDGADSAEFAREAERFMADYDNLTAVLFNKADGRLMFSGSFTQEGRDVAVNVIKPVVYRWPGVVKLHKADGSPEIRVPPTPDSWHLNGVVCLGFLAERLMAAAAKDGALLFELVNLSNPDPEKLLAWAEANVPELAGPMEEQEGGETL